MLYCGHDMPGRYSISTGKAQPLTKQGEQDMHQTVLQCTRRHLAHATCTMAIITAASMLPATVQAAETPAQLAEVTQAVESLRVAMESGNEKTLNAMVEDHLTYGHSRGKVQNKAEFIKSISGPAAPSKIYSLKLSGQTVDIVDNVALVRHVYDSENAGADGKPAKAHILNLQIWKKEASGWKLLARQACPL